MIAPFPPYPILLYGKAIFPKGSYNLILDLAAAAAGAIRFDQLGLSPVALDLGFFTLKWYSLAYLAGIFELLLGLFVLVGFQTRISAVLLAAFAAFTGLVFHSGAINVPDFPAAANGLLTMFNGLMMMKNLTIAGGFLALAAAGAGAYSVDGRRGSVAVAA